MERLSLCPESHEERPKTSQLKTDPISGIRLLVLDLFVSVRDYQRLSPPRVPPPRLLSRL